MIYAILCGNTVLCITIYVNMVHIAIRELFAPPLLPIDLLSIAD